MEGGVDAVPGVLAHHSVAESFRVGLDHAPDHRGGTSRFDRFDGAVHGLLGALREKP